MTIAWMSFPYTSSSVPSSPPGSWWSIARSVVQTCGHLNFGFTAFTSNDCWSVEESPGDPVGRNGPTRSEEHTSELQSRLHLVCRLLLEKKKKKQKIYHALFK